MTDKMKWGVVVHVKGSSVRKSRGKVGAAHSKSVGKLQKTRVSKRKLGFQTCLLSSTSFPLCAFARPDVVHVLTELAADDGEIGSNTLDRNI